MRSIWLLGCLGCVVLTSVASADPAPVPPTDPPQTPAPPPSDSHQATAPVPGTPAAIAPSSLLVAPAPRLAPPSSVPPISPRVDDRDETVTEPSYRLHLLVADTAALALTLTTTRAGVLAGASIYLLDGLVIHGSHDRIGRGIGSLALRAGLPVLATIVGGMIWWHGQDSRCRAGDPDYCSDDELNVGALYGFGLGILGAMVIDTALLARPATVHRRAAVTWTPRVSATRDQVALGITGGF
jgi:hypothetical protein